MNTNQALDNIEKVLANSTGNREYHQILQQSMMTVREELSRLQTELTTAKVELESKNGTKAK